MTRDATTAFARTLVDEWVRHGVTDACLAPGSRSAPLALALAGDDRIRLHVHLDERSASFFALGLAKASGRPAVVLCTSGTAAANFHPAVLEAHHGRVPMIVCTADRPPELRDTGAGQTVDQVKLYGDAVRWFCDAGVPDDRAGRGRGVARAGGAHGRRRARPARRARAPATSRSASRWCRPATPLVDAPGRSDGRPWTARAPGVRAPIGGMLDALTHARRPTAARSRRRRAGARACTRRRSCASPRPPAGRCSPTRSRTSGCPAPSRPTTRCSAAPRFAGSHRPDVVVRIGGPLTNKVAMQWLDADDRPGARRSRRRVARSAARGRAVGWSPTPSCSSTRSPRASA